MYLRDLGASFIDVLFPPLCLSCSELLVIRSDFICPTCLGLISRIEHDDPSYESICASLREGGLVQDLVVPFWFDKGSPLQSIIHALKYQQIPQVGIFLGELVGKELLRTGRHVDHLIPIPLHKAKQREREYNQAEYIARGISNVSGVDLLTDAVMRRVHTSTQTDLTAVERRKNVHRVFSLNDRRVEQLKNKRVLIVDDVVTTGATVLSLAGELVSRAECRVLIASVALAAKEGNG